MRQHNVGDFICKFNLQISLTTGAESDCVINEGLIVD